MSKKRIIFISVIVILIVISGLYATYAINVFMEEGTPSTYDMAINFELAGSVNREMTVEAGKTKVFDIDIKNPYDDKIQYGVAYSMVSPTTLPSGVIVAASSLSKNDAKGLIDANSTISVSIVIANNSSESVTISFSIVNGYKNGGDLIVPESKTLIEEIYEVVLSPSLETLRKLGLESSLNSGTPDFNTMATTDEGIYAAEDDLGTSYYFRGAVENNYVYFAGFYWRIIRINGDGTIRVIYDGKSAHTNGEFSADRGVGSSQYNIESGDNAYVGYMYGTAGSSTYEETHANVNNSTIKTYLDNWYQTNLSSYSSAISDAIYCNDRSLDPSDASYIGIGTTDAEYGADYRLKDNKEPILTCPLENDKFSKSTSIGNGKLTYPIGLIMADEVGFAGDSYSGDPNYYFYLYCGDNYWTISPIDKGRIIYGKSGATIGYTCTANLTNYVRPVISLKPSTITSGSGTMSNPFTTG